MVRLLAGLPVEPPLLRDIAATIGGTCKCSNGLLRTQKKKEEIAHKSTIKAWGQRTPKKAKAGKRSRHKIYKDTCVYSCFFITLDLI